MDLANIKTLREKTGIGVSECKKALAACGNNIEKSVEYLRKKGIVSSAKKANRPTKEGVIECVKTSNGVLIFEMLVETDFVLQNQYFLDLKKNIGKVASTLENCTLEELLKAPMGTLSVEDSIKTEVFRIKENIKLSRVRLVKKTPNCTLGFYSHNKGAMVSIVEVEGSNDDLAKDLAMHVVASNPFYVDVKEVPQNVIEKEKEIAKATIKKVTNTNIVEKIIDGKLKNFYKNVCLVEQEFFKDSKLSVGQLLGQHKCKVLNFLRWHVGG